VVSFSHDQAGTSERFWHQDGWPDLARPLAFSGCSRLIVVAAHPDDETLGAGGLISAAAGRGIPVTVLVATNGEASHPHSPTHTPADLAAIRRVEVLAAVRALAPEAQVRLLDLPDGDLGQHRNSLEEAIWDEAMRETVPADGTGEPPAGSTDATAPVTANTWLVAPWRQDGHPDHTVAGAAAALVAERTGARLLEYPIWAWHWSTPADGIWPGPGAATASWRLDLDETARTAKHTALAAHQSQVEALSDLAGDEAIVQPGFAAHFERDYELFLGASVATLSTLLPCPSPYPAAGDSSAVSSRTASSQIASSRLWWCWARSPSGRSSNRTRAAAASARTAATTSTRRTAARSAGVWVGECG
jgi:LmbE family N-acetylglucosaminyl deacetylase